MDESAAFYNSPPAANVHRAVKESRKSASIRDEDALAKAHDNLMDKCKASRCEPGGGILTLDLRCPLALHPRDCWFAEILREGERFFSSFRRAPDIAQAGLFLLSSACPPGFVVVFSGDLFTAQNESSSSEAGRMDCLVSISTPRSYL